MGNCSDLLLAIFNSSTPWKGMVEHWQNLENQKGEGLGYVMGMLQDHKYTNLNITSV